MLAHDVGTTNWLVKELTETRLVDLNALEPVVRSFHEELPFGDSVALAEWLVRARLLTEYQARRVIDGEGRKLLLGAYVLQDVLGSGSLGPVYLARGRADQKPYAVKVLPQRNQWNVRLAQASACLRTTPSS